MARAYRATARIARVVAFCSCAAVSLAELAALPAHAAEREVRQSVVTRVIDGDTFVIAGGARVRVRNFDTPELRHYDCPEEKKLAQAARDAARALLQGARVRLEVTGEDRYRRLVADVYLRRALGEVSFTEAMIATGHGAPWDYGNEPQPNWCPPDKSAGAAQLPSEDPPG